MFIFKIIPIDLTIFLFFYFLSIILWKKYDEESAKYFLYIIYFLLTFYLIYFFPKITTYIFILYLIIFICSKKTKEYKDGEKNFEKELKNNQLEKMNHLYRFAEFGKISSGIFHDLINHLTAISLNVEKLKDNNKSVDYETKEYLNKTLEISGRMESLMRTVRKQLKFEDQKTDFNIIKEIEDAIELLSHRAKKINIKILLKHNLNPFKKMVINGNYIKFSQVIVNLLSNAIDSYDTKKLKKNKNIYIIIKEDTNYVEILINDNGKGISKNIIEKIFEPFFSTKENDLGMGLGLSTTKRIIEKDFRGSISVKSRLKKGSTFKIRIPKNNN